MLSGAPRRMAACAALVVVAACSKPAEPPPGAQAKGGPPPAMPVTVAPAIEREVREWDDFSGRLEAIETVEVRSRVAGYVDSVNFRAGSIVRKGELLAVIDPRPFQAELARQEAELARAVTRAELAKTEAARAERLLGVKAISQQEYDQLVSGNREADSGIRAARAAVDVARLNVEFTRVVAPIAGRVGRAEVTTGNFVGAGGAAITTIVSIDPMYVYFEADEPLYLKYQKLAAAGERPSSRTAKNEVLMGLANDEGYPRKGTMDFVDNRLDPRTGTIRVRAVFPNKDGQLTPGLFARVRLVGSGVYQAVLVTDRAIGTDQNQKFLLVVGKDNVLEYRPVKIGALIDGLRVIADGLKAGELVVVNGLQRVRPGMPVQPQQVAMEAEPKAPAPPPKPEAAKK